MTREEFIEAWFPSPVPRKKQNTVLLRDLDELIATAKAEERERMRFALCCDVEERFADEDLDDAAYYVKEGIIEDINRVARGEEAKEDE